MRKLFSVSLLLILFFSCNHAGGSDKYSIQGTVKNHTAKSIMLEQLGLQKITLIDSSAIDEKGNFQMGG